MQAKCSSTDGFWEDEWDTSASLASQAFTLAGQPQPKPAEHKAGCAAWRALALALLTLCLVLMVGLVALGLVFLQFYQLSNSQRGSLSEMEERLGNLSGALQALRAHSRALAGSLQRVAERLCRELYDKRAGHRCSPCPDTWWWQGARCYKFSGESRSWQGCQSYCEAESASMLKIDTQDALAEARRRSYSEFFDSYWTGLARRAGGAWLWADGTALAPRL
ncbi:C-type lectin domain family 1 member A, partial [Dipodomys spectabilis]|uniref:C-type lectin domain family 1 member A n=1 Tax=Dipodomys spectabilis TaxID=105255 RepID=UPI001C5396F6